MDLATVGPRDVFGCTKDGHWTVVPVGSQRGRMVLHLELCGGEELVQRESTMERGGE
jgi:hypothetical protein